MAHMTRVKQEEMQIWTREKIRRLDKIVTDFRLLRTHSPKVVITQGSIALYFLVLKGVFKLENVSALLPAQSIV